MDLRGGMPSPDWYVLGSTWVSANAIKLSIATALAKQEYSGAALNGAIGAALIAPECLITATSSAFAATYNTTDPILVDGLTVDGKAVQAKIFLTLAGGGETRQSDIALAYVTKITVPAQLTTSGAFTFGIGDIVLLGGCRRVEMQKAVSGVVKGVTQSGRSVDLTLPQYGVRDIALAKLLSAQADFPVVIYR